MGHQASVPAAAASYFGISQFGTPYRDHPVIAQVFRDGVGWGRLGYTKRISMNVARQLRKDGVSEVALAYRNRVADFRVAELVH